MEHHPLEHQDFRSGFRIGETGFHAGRNVGAERGGLCLFQLRQRAALAGKHPSKHQKDVRIGEYYQTRYDLGAAELKDYLDALNTADNSMLSALEAKYRVIRYENQIYKAMGGRYERILPPSGGKATQGHTSTNGETHVPSQRNQ